jgi:hypothetical protein
VDPCIADWFGAKGFGLLELTFSGSVLDDLPKRAKDSTLQIPNASALGTLSASQSRPNVTD